MPFSFNFSVESEDNGCEHDQDKSSVPESNISWSNSKEQVLQDFHLENISSMLSIEHFDVGSSALNFVNSESVGKCLSASDYSGELTPALSASTDLVPGVYEGGLKIWECSEDLVHWLDHTRAGKLDGLKVLELGCGAGLPGIYCFKEGASGKMHTTVRCLITS